MKRSHSQDDQNNNAKIHSRDAAPDASAGNDTRTNELFVDLSQEAAGRIELPTHGSDHRHSTNDGPPCPQPVNNRMCTTEDRLRTFQELTWSARQMLATPQQFANAGFYYLGERDRVKCWYCNGGLQNWERDDDPWEEHAKWFPLCEYVLQRKGPDYVHQIVARFPGLRRPILPRPFPVAALPELLRNLLHSTESTPPTSPCQQPDVIDPLEIQQDIATKVESDMNNSIFVKQASAMGFSENTIRTALKEHYTLYDEPFHDMESLIDEILKLKDEERTEQFTASSEQCDAQHVPSSQEGAAQSELRRLEEQRQCKVCRNEDASVLFVPCSHLCCCAGCSKQRKRCPLCSILVRDKFQTASKTEGKAFL